MKLKSAPVRLKDAGADIEATGEFEAIVSVFGHVDSWGDVVQPGAFVDTLKEWADSSSKLPVLWSHRMDDPAFNIGEVLDIKELEANAPEIPEWVDPFVREHGGLWVKGRIDTGPDASLAAVHALRLMKARRVTQFSYAYDEVDAGWAKVNGDQVWELRKLKLYEVSPTQIGANELTELLAAKAGTKIGRTISASNEDKIRQAIDLLTDVVESLDSGEDNSEESKDEAQTGKSSKHKSPESSRVLRQLTTALIDSAGDIDD